MIGTTTPKAQYTGNGAATGFSTVFTFPTNAEVTVRTYDPATGAETLLTEGVNYTLTGAGTGAAGTVTFGTAPASGIEITIRRETKLSQDLDLVNSGAFDSEALEKTGLDRAVMLAQDIQERLGRTVQLRKTSKTAGPVELPEPSPGLYLGWPASGAKLSNLANIPTTIAGMGVGSPGKLLQVDATGAALETITHVPPAKLRSIATQPYKNLVIKNNVATPLSKVDITADEIDVEGWIFTAVSKTADITASGANGLDTGVEANVWYHIWAIANVGDPAAPVIASLLSAHATAPTMPSGYSLKRYLGAIYNNASNNFISIVQRNRNVSRAIVVVRSASATPATPELLSLASAIPVTATGVVGVTEIISSSIAYGQIHATSSGSLGLNSVVCVAGGDAQSTFVLTLAENQSLYWAVTASASTYNINISGWSY